MSAPDTTQTVPVTRGALAFELATVLILSLCVALSAARGARSPSAGMPGYVLGTAISPLILVGVPYFVARVLVKQNKRRNAAIVALVLSALILLGTLGSVATAVPTTPVN